MKLSTSGMCRHCSSAPILPPSNPAIVKGRNAFQKVAPFTVKDVGCRPIFHLGLKGGYMEQEHGPAKFCGSKTYAWTCLGLFLFGQKSKCTTCCTVQLTALLLGVLLIIYCSEGYGHFRAE